MTLRIVGDRPLAQRLVGLAKVTVLGRLDREGAYREMGGAWAQVLLGTWYGNCPTVAIQALGGGLPVIGSAIGGIPELVDDGVTGWRFEANRADSLPKAIKLTHSDPSLLTSSSHVIRRQYESGFAPNAAYCARF